MLVLGVRALLDRGLDPPASICRGACFACVLRVFCESERELERIRERIKERIREREREREREN